MYADKTELKRDDNEIIKISAEVECAETNKPDLKKDAKGFDLEPV